MKKIPSIATVIVVVIAAVLGLAGATRADYMAYSVEELTTKATIIARVRVVSIRPDPDNQPSEMEQTVAGAFNGLALVHVVEPFKGVRKNSTIEVAFTNQTCIGVGYKAGEDCVIFLARENGVYKTFNFGNGKKYIGKNTTYADLSAQIKEQLKKDAAAPQAVPPAAKD